MLLVDLDSIFYAALFAVDGFYPSIRAADNITCRILDKFSDKQPLLIQGGPGNFRKSIDPTYKANRKPAPPYLYDLKQYYLKYWGAIQSEGCEADDLIGTLATPDCILAVNDKDYNQLGVPIYNWKKDQLIEIIDPHYYWWLQMLVGDAADNIPGVKNPAKSHWKNPPNFTESTASEILLNKTKEEMRDTVIEQYKTAYGDKWFEEYDKKSRLLFLWRKDTKSYSDVYN